MEKEKMVKKIVTSIFISGVIFLLGCASNSADIGTAYVSPLQYQNYDCDQIVMEMERVSRRISEVL